MFRYPALAKAIVAVAVMVFPNRLAAALTTPLGKLPIGWKVLQSFNASPDQVAAISTKVGGRINKLSNSIVSIHGRRFQVNIFHCAAPSEAAKIHKSVLAMKGHPAFCLKLDSTVVEFVGSDTALAVVAAFELGFKSKPKRATYRISFDAAPMKTGDYMQWNNLYNLFLAADQDPANPPRDRINRLAKSFTFTDKVVLRTAGAAGAYPTYRFTPPPTPRDPIPGKAVATYTFKNLPLKLGVPSLKVQATVITTQDALTPTTRRADADLLGPTEFWSSDDPQIIAFAKRITAGCKTQKDKTDALLKWLQPGRNIKFGGPVTGSRYGVKKTLKQRFGQCWDFSDCFITFCRALQIPSRQVAGWLYGQDGHIWAEVLYENSGWQQVDPTGGGLVGCGIYHIPYLTSEQGSLPILYLSQPKIDFLAN